MNFSTSLTAVGPMAREFFPVAVVRVTNEMLPGMPMDSAGPFVVTDAFKSCAIACTTTGFYVYFMNSVHNYMNLPRRYLP